MFHSIKRRLIKSFTKLYDPNVELAIGNSTIKIPLSHDLRDIVRLYPEYNYNLARIVAHLNKRNALTKVIDIGANIGDTVAFIKSMADVPILCIDGEAKFVKLLRENTSSLANVFVCESLVGAENKKVTLQLKSDKGTAHLREGGNAVMMRTLDNILDEYTEFKTSNIIKTDTDGFDTIILRSCEAFLQKNTPVIFMEFDPHLINRNRDDAFSFMEFLEKCGYKYFIFYTNIGDYMLSCSSSDKSILQEIIHYFSGRKLELFADLCAFAEKDKNDFEEITANELIHFRKVRKY